VLAGGQALGRALKSGALVEWRLATVEIVEAVLSAERFRLRVDRDRRLESRLPNQVRFSNLVRELRA
jgi:hypothetical protein